ncbi:latrophilin-like protein 1 [Eurytemora carolleeae]|uniref:latrophilin-like protein 1 n=1 Tax=Eurytemora carolleeae TaxID=1294199 RepID=UPI000C781D0E|nr:latrophilin-like protein 1 [Eurytemora carolleeae]|eukprot:XP_023323611.1 latrophilin-like protein 1 [Eurytemora affinis]
MNTCLSCRKMKTKKMYTFVIFFFRFLGLQAREVAVILGGVNNKGAHLEIPEIYSPWPSDSCVTDILLPRHPSMEYAAAVYLENAEMLILCATSKRNCYSLTKGEVQWNLHSGFPDDSKYGNLFSWTAPGDLKLWFLGNIPRIQREFFVYQQYWDRTNTTFDDAAEYCSVKLNLGGSDQIVSMGGLIGWSNNYYTKTRFYCKDQNDFTCPGGNGLEYSWKEPDIELGKVDGTSCTSFTHNTHGTSILLTGRSPAQTDNIVKVFYVEECFKGNVSSCVWFSVADFEYSLNRAVMTTVDDFPFIFGPEFSTGVRLFNWQYGNSWTEYPPMKIARGKHTVVPVPISFFTNCQELSTNSTTTPIERTTTVEDITTTTITTTTTTATTATTTAATTTVVTTITATTTADTSTAATTTAATTTAATTTAATTTAATTTVATTTAATTTAVTTTAATVVTTTTTTTTTTNSTSTTTAEDIQPGICTGTDKRGIAWTAEYNKNAYMACSEDDFESGTAYWFCNGSTGEFQTEQPDRSSCSSPWIDDIQDQLDGGSETAVNISEKIMEKIYDGEALGGDLIFLTEILSELIIRHGNETKLGDKEDNFLENLLNISNVLMMDSLPWKEISNDSVRYQASSNIVLAVQSGGYQFLDTLSANECQIFSQEYHELEKIKLMLNTTKHVNDCYRMPNSTICLPSAVSAELTADCYHVVSVNYLDIQNNETAMFPEQIGHESTNHLFNNIIGLTINNDTEKIVINQTQGNEPVQIFFYNIDEKAGQDAVCGFWDFDSKNWSQHGCSLNLKLSKSGVIVCDCYHLTHFGIFMDYSGKGRVSHYDFTTASQVGLSVSIISIVLTEILLLLVNKTAKWTDKRFAEFQRNVWLLLGQFSFLVLVPMASVVSNTVCESFGALTLLFWSLFFTWSGLEGFILYRQISFPFETKHINKIILCMSYAVPLALSSVLFMISNFTESKMFIRQEAEEDEEIGHHEGEVTGVCWLNSDYIWIFISLISLILIFNLFVIMKAVAVAYQSAIFRKQSKEMSLLSSMRNILILCIILCSGFLVGLIPYSEPQQWVFLLLNSFSGFYIFLYTCFLCRRKMQEMLRKNRLYGYSKSLNSAMSMNTTVHRKGKDS